MIGERCQCTAAYYQCKDLTDEDRSNIFSEVWKMSWSEKEVYVRMAVEAKDVKERRGNEKTSRRNKSFVFTLRGSKGLHRVCKAMFLQTTGLKSWWVKKRFPMKEKFQLSLKCHKNYQKGAYLSEIFLTCYQKCQPTIVGRIPQKCTLRQVSSHWLISIENTKNNAQQKTKISCQ